MMNRRPPHRRRPRLSAVACSSGSGSGGVARRVAAILLSTTAAAAGPTFSSLSSTTTAFVPNRPSSRHSSTTERSTRTQTPPEGLLFMSSIGGGNMDNNEGGGGGGSDDDNPLNEWMQRRDSDNVRQIREQFAEGRLPISYGAMNEGEDTKKKNGKKFGPIQNATQTTDDAIDTTSTPDVSGGLARSKANPYLNVVSRLTPSDLISRFTSTASPRVQDAVRTTVLGLIGGLPSMAFETKTIATGERLASLMFQLQMTGYMFKNAEYRLSMSQGLGRSDRMLPGGVGGESSADEDARAVKEGKGRLKGKIKVQYGVSAGKTTANDDEEDERSTGDVNIEDDDDRPVSSFSSPGLEVEVDAQAYMSELRGEVSRLRDELEATKQAKEEEIRKDLLMYIRTLPQQELQQLTGTMSPEVLEAMKGLVTAVLAGIGEDEEEEMLGNAVTEGTASKIGPDTVTEQSGEALAQLCMWQLVVGFNLRELEVREEFRASMTNMLGDGDVGSGTDGSADEGGDGGVQFGPGALE